MSPAAIHARMRAVVDALLVGLFAAAIAAPTLDALARDETARGPGPEMRRPAPMPPLPTGVWTASQFPARFEAHFGDTFGLRDRLLRLNSLEKHYVLATSPTHLIVRGRDGWIFWGGDRSTESFRGALPMTEAELGGWQHALEGRARALAEHGCRFLWVMAPSKETIYPERMPSALRPIGPTRLDQLCAWMAQRSDVDVLDLRPALRAAKADDTGPFDVLYTPHGTHWSGRGALVVYRAIVEHLAREHPRARPLALDELEAVSLPAAPDSLAGHLYLQGSITSPDVVFLVRDPHRIEVVRKHDQPPESAGMPESAMMPASTVTLAHGEGLLPPTVMFHDSFGPFIWALMAASCERLETYGGQFDARLVDPGTTRIVIQMYVERALVTWAPDTIQPEVDEPAARFESMPHALFDLASALDSVAAVHGLEIEEMDLEGRTVLRFTRRAPRQALVLPAVRLPAQGEVAAWIEIDCARPSLFDMVWRAAGAQAFRRRDRTTIALEAGRNERLVLLPATGVETELMLYVREPDVEVTLRALRLRSSAAP